MSIMRVRGLLCLALSIAARAMAQSPGFLLGVDYSEWLPLDATQIATDSYGALYILSVSDSANSFVTKLSADGTKMLWQNQLGFVAVAMAVDPYGGVYVVPASQSWDTSFYVAKLSAGGTGVAWETPVAFIPNGLVQPRLAAALLAGSHQSPLGPGPSRLPRQPSLHTQSRLIPSRPEPPTVLRPSATPA